MKTLQELIEWHEDRAAYFSNVPVNEMHAQTAKMLREQEDRIAAYALDLAIKEGKA